MQKEIKRIIEIASKYHLSHVGSCVSALPIIQRIYETKQPIDKFVLSCGHAALALYVVLERKGGRNAEEIFNHHGVHPDKCDMCGLDCSSGSLGHGIGIAVGMAMADRSKHIYVLISDGECAEGSVWEALRIAFENGLDNLHIHVNANGWGAYQSINLQRLEEQLNLFFPVIFHTTNSDLPFCKGLAAHYYVPTKGDYVVF